MALCTHLCASRCPLWASVPIYASLCAPLWHSSTIYASLSAFLWPSVPIYAFLSAPLWPFVPIYASLCVPLCPSVSSMALCAYLCVSVPLYDPLCPSMRLSLCLRSLWAFLHAFLFVLSVSLLLCLIFLCYSLSLNTSLIL